MSDGFEWLDWLEPSGPFVAAPVLKKAFPQGLDTLDPNKRRALRQAYDEYRQALDDEDPEAGKFHAVWIDLVLRQGLEYDEDESGVNLKAAGDLPDSLVSQVAEHGVTLKPDYAVVDDQNADKPMMLIRVYGQDVDLNDAVRGDGWASSPRERMVRLCRDTGIRLGLVTNGEHWLFVDAPVSAISSFASWYARLWGPEPVLLQAFVDLLGIRRFFFAENEQLPAFIDKSAEFQDEVTEALGEQVRRAVEVLIQALDKADVDRNRELLKDVDPRELYEAGLTVMMRLVFLLSAEERELLLLGDERYEANYAVSTLRMQLRSEDDAILQRRWDAWSRLLAIFRAIYGGIEHETLRMPALGGSLFDPDRFPFLEGRDKDSNWKTDPAKPLPIDNQTVLLLLDAIQLFEGRTLSYRGLDIEQLGYVYEGLLDHTVKRAREVTLELDATKSAKQPWATLGELESARLDDVKAVEKLLKERTGSSISRVRNDLKRDVKPQQSIGLLTACHNDQPLHDQLKRFFHLIRTDSWGRPLVYPKGSFMVTTGEDRRQTGSHYTPASLTEEIVKHALEPLVYDGPAEGKPTTEWRLKSPEELLDLKICDPAMGSGAFLVQVCRWLGERLVESWSQSEIAGKQVGIDGAIIAAGGGSESMPRDSEERTVNAKRLIAERCIYGVDINPLAVELAKLSIWLVTMAKNRPFGFLDHNLRSGDSLLGLHEFEQLLNLNMDPVGAQQQLFAQNIRDAVSKATVLRRSIRRQPLRNIRDVEFMRDLNTKAHGQIRLSSLIADVLVGEVFAAEGNATDVTAVSISAGAALDGDVAEERSLQLKANADLKNQMSDGQSRRYPIHWFIEFPEVFDREDRGFDAIVGNPPFLGGRRIRRSLGSTYLKWLTGVLCEQASANADLCAFFFRRAASLVNERGTIGLLATNTISQGDTRKTGLGFLLGGGISIYRAVTNYKWPGAAQLTVSILWLTKRSWLNDVDLDGLLVSKISDSLAEQGQHTEDPHVLLENKGKSFQGSIVLGSGFVLTPAQAELLIAKNTKNRDVLFPYLRGEDFTSRPDQSPTKWVINFFDWPLDAESAPPAYVGPTAADYPDCLKIIEAEVKPERTRRKSNGKYALRSPLPQKWWIYSDKRPALYRTIAEMQRVMFHSFTGKYVAFGFVPVGYVYAGPHNVFALDSYSDFGILQSSFHNIWVWKYCSTMETRVRYANRKLFETFPFPQLADWRPAMEMTARKYYEARQLIMQDREEGLTSIYNRMNRQEDRSEDICRLRKLHQKMDEAVAAAYGWDDIELELGFHEVAYLPSNDRIRFTISERARLAVLDRLLELNMERSEYTTGDALLALQEATTSLSITDVADEDGLPQRSLDL